MYQGTGTMPRSKTGKKRESVNSDNLKRAIEVVTAEDDTKISLREACKTFDVKLTTLSRKLKRFRESEATEYSYEPKFDDHKAVA
ncbi:hypothetical protein J6590_105951 [Homalodisca vitripennis]|nr:hypothetical protein J6590_105951 [Homalodisca vitripennis]